VTPRAIPEPDPERYLAAAELAERAPEPASVGNVRFGTAGWTDRTLVKPGLFYPRGTRSARERLEFYARHFTLVEVDATYYTLIAPELSARWAEITPDRFRFDVKAHPVVTGHPVDVTRLPVDLRDALSAAGHEQRVYPDRMPAEIAGEIERRFRASLEPLRAAGKLASVLVQFPPWFHATRGNSRRLEAVAERWQELPLAVEFRHRSWLEERRRERVLDLLRRQRLSYVCVDEPDVAAGGVPPLTTVTNPALAVVRFHGHNAGGWSKQGASVHERFDYVYTPGELRGWVAPLVRLAAEAESVHAVFNNCVRNYAVLNAKGLAVLLEAERQKAPD
jgi:uncharacterized protein YecE (DUF72 family)